MFVKMMMMAMMVMTLNGTPVKEMEHHYYAKVMEVVTLDYETDEVVCIDTVGYEWAFYGIEDYSEGDLIACVMDDMGTSETIFDDEIINSNYAGYWIE